MLIQQYNTPEFPFSHPMGYKSNIEDPKMQEALISLLKLKHKNAEDVRFTMNNSKGRLLVNNSTSDDGMQRTIDTLTSISKEVFRAKYYTIDFSELVPISTEGAYLENMFNYSVVAESTDFQRGFYKLSDSIRPVSSDITISSKTIALGAYHRKIRYNIFQQKQGDIINFSIIQEMMAAEKKVNDLGVQEFVFLGQANSTDFQGLLNNSAYSVDTTTLTDFLYSLSDSDYLAFANQLILQYYVASNYTELPNRWLIPIEEIKGLSTFVSSAYPLRTRLEVLETAFKTALASIGNPKRIVVEGKETVDFKIVATPYASKTTLATRGISQNRYLLYKFSNDVADCGLKIHMPLDFVNFGTYTVDGINYESSYLTQMSGVNIYRPKQFLCLAHTK